MVDELEETIMMVENRSNVVDCNVEQRFISCGKGSCEFVVDGNPEAGYGEFENFDLTLRGRGHIWKIYVCNNCGNMQLFRPDQAKNPKIWDRGNRKMPLSDCQRGEACLKSSFERHLTGRLPV